MMGTTAGELAMALFLFVINMPVHYPARVGLTIGIIAVALCVSQRARPGRIIDINQWLVLERQGALHARWSRWRLSLVRLSLTACPGSASESP